MPSRKMIYMPTAEEDRKITSAAMSDPDALPLSDDDWARARDASGRLLDPMAYAKVELRSLVAELDRMKGDKRDAVEDMIEELRSVLAKAG